MCQPSSEPGRRLRCGIPFYARFSRGRSETNRCKLSVKIPISHHYQFAIDDGRLLHATEEPCRGLRTFEVVYEGNEVGVILSD